METEKLIKGKKIADITKLFGGKKAKIINMMYSGHGLSIGEEVTIKSCLGNMQAPYFGSYSCETSAGIRTIYGSEMDIRLSYNKENILEDIANLKKNIQNYEKEIVLLQNKLEFIEENKLEEFDENTFKAYHTLKLIDNNKLSQIEKAKLISNLISQ